MNRAALCLPPLAALLLAAGCSDTQGYPSLARRPAERAIEAPAPTPAPTPAATPDPNLDATLARLVEQARAAHRQFEAKRGRAEALAAAGGRSAMGSEGWAVASIALAELESARSDAMIAMADLDRIYIAERTGGGDGLTIAAARDQVSAWIAEEDSLLSSLRLQLGG